MTMNVGRQIAELRRMTVTQLRQKHIEAFGEPTRSGHKDYLVKRIAWRMQGVRGTQGSGDTLLRVRGTLCLICVLGRVRSVRGGLLPGSPSTRFARSGLAALAEGASRSCRTGGFTARRSP